MKRSRLILPAVIASPADGTAQTGGDSHATFDFAPAAVVTVVWHDGGHDGAAVQKM